MIFKLNSFRKEKKKEAKKKRKDIKMTDENNKQKGRSPDFKGDGVAVWTNQKDGRTYLSIKLVGHNTIYASKNEPKTETKEETIEE